MAEAFIVGLGETPHAARRDDVNTTEIAYEAVKAALQDAGVALAEIGSAITASQDFWEGRTISSMAVNEIAGATFKSESKTASDGALALTYAAMRIVSDLERMGDLAVHIAKVARMRFPDHAVPQEVRPAFLEAGHVAEMLITKAATVIAKRDAAAAQELEKDDDAMDRIHRGLFRELLSDDWPHGIETAIDITLLGRYYERFADHAVSVALRVIYLVTGEREPVSAS